MLLALGLGAVLVCRVPGCGATAFDQSLMRLAHHLRAEGLDRAFIVVTWGGSLFVLVPVVLVTALLLVLRQRRAEALFLAAALAGGSAAAHAGKLLVARPRPDLFDAVTAMPQDLAYPSAHSAQATALALALYLLARRRNPAHLIWLAPLLVVGLALVAISRIYLQVHYPTDVVAGVVTSALWVAGLAALLLSRDGNASHAQ
jgi:membrane-associated phospholipid phosphatase